MQTSSHLVYGIAAGAALFPHNLAAVALCAFGAIAPDLPMVLPFVLDKLRGRPPMKEQGEFLMLMKNISHNVFIWLMLLAIGWHGASLLLALAVGGLSHIAVDMLTHGSPEFNRYDCMYFAPFQKRPWNIGPWDYRIATGQLWPLKPFEGLTFSASILLASYFLVMNFLA